MNDCLFALSGQPDEEAGSTNEVMYFGFNRVVNDDFGDRSGHGTCKVQISWQCSGKYIRLSLLYPRYEVYRGYIVFTLSVIMFVCLSVCLKTFFPSKISQQLLGLGF